MKATALAVLASLAYAGDSPAPYSVPGNSSSVGPTGTAPVPQGYTTVTSDTTIYTTYCPYTATHVSGSETLTTTYMTTSTVTEVYTSTVVGPAPAKVTVTNYITEQTTVCPMTCESTLAPYPTGPAHPPYGSAPPPPPYGSAPPPLPYGSAPPHPPYGSGSPTPSTYYPAPPKCTTKPFSFDSCKPCEGNPGSDPSTFCGYTIEDNYYQVIPNTCNEVEYDFHITNTTIAPDGIERMALLVNGQMPGPTVEANWGDWIVIHVHNELDATAGNGTSIHFHGFRQNGTNEMDGVPSITQCALAPGNSMTYRFRANNYGTSWWHSHFALQTYEGILGPVIIHGPASAAYDEEQVVVLQDWTHATVDEMYDSQQAVQSTPPHSNPLLDTGLINGMNVWEEAETPTGQRFEMTVQGGKSYRLRLINTAIQSTFKFFIDQHTFTVIQSDFVPLKPYTTNIVNINIGQRYDLIFKADQAPGSYWMRADNQAICGPMIQSTNIKGVIRYEGTDKTATPTSTAYTYQIECVDEPLESLVPYLALNAGAQDQTVEETVVIAADNQTPNLYKWTLSGATFMSQWGDPTLYDIVNFDTVPSYSGRLAIEIPNLGEWVYFIIQSPVPLAHPIHFHGHDFMILGQGYGFYNGSVPLNTVNPPRRDVALMPANPIANEGGYLVIGYQTSNPGAWLMHCHTGWHNEMGFALQIIENQAGIKDTVTDTCSMDNTCAAWRKYAATHDVTVTDSGV